MSIYDFNPDHDPHGTATVTAATCCAGLAALLGTAIMAACMCL
jgi:hypothetical protein